MNVYTNAKGQKIIETISRDKVWELAMEHLEYQSTKMREEIGVFTGTPEQINAFSRALKNYLTRSSKPAGDQAKN